MAEARTMMALGDFAFSISTAAYDELCRDNEWRWPAVDTIGSRPARQYIGPGDETISLRGIIYPHFVAQDRGLDQMDDLRALADKGLSRLLVDGRGLLWGEFCMLRLRETQRVFFSDGTPRSVEFELELGNSGVKTEQSSAE